MKNTCSQEQNFGNLTDKYVQCFERYGLDVTTLGAGKSGGSARDPDFDVDLYLHLARTFVSLMDLGRSRNKYGVVANAQRGKLVFPLPWLQVWAKSPLDAFRMFVDWSFAKRVTVDKQLECRHLRVVKGSVICRGTNTGGRQSVDVLLGQDVPEANWIWDCNPVWLNTVAFRRRPNEGKGYLTPYGQERVDAGSGRRKKYPCRDGNLTVAERFKKGCVVSYGTLLRRMNMEWDLDEAAETRAKITGRPPKAKDVQPRKNVPPQPSGEGDEDE